MTGFWVDGSEQHERALQQQFELQLKSLRLRLTTALSDVDREQVENQIRELQRAFRERKRGAHRRLY
jgi:hypothetical protein